MGTVKEVHKNGMPQKKSPRIMITEATIPS